MGQDFVVLEYLFTAILLKETITIQVLPGLGVSLGLNGNVYVFCKEIGLSIPSKHCLLLTIKN